MAKRSWQADSSKNNVMSSTLHNAIYFQRRRILPTAEQHLYIRKEEERKELQRWTMGDESIVTLDSLPYVYDSNSVDDVIQQQQRQNKEDVNYEHADDIIDRSCRRIDCRDEVVGDNVKEQDMLAIIAATARRVNTDPFQDDDGGDNDSSDEDFNSDNESILLTEKVFENNTGIIYARAAIPTTVGRSNKKSCIVSSSEAISGCSSKKAIATSSDWMTTYRRSESELMGMVSLPSTSRRNSNLPCVTSSRAGVAGRKATVDNNNWHRRRSELELVVSRIKRKKQHSLSRNGRRQSTPTTSSDAPDDMSAADEALQRRRTTLRFAAARVAVNKRKKQKSLKDMFKL